MKAYDVFALVSMSSSSFTILRFSSGVSLWSGLVRLVIISILVSDLEAFR